jgi:hypothetical protein
VARLGRRKRGHGAGDGAGLVLAACGACRRRWGATRGAGGAGAARGAGALERVGGAGAAARRGPAQGLAREGAGVVRH